MISYRSINRAAYNKLTPVYMRRVEHYRSTDIFLLHPFTSYLTTRYAKTARILEIGPGVGSNLALLSGLGFPVVGVDISDCMIRAAKIAAPHAQLIHGDFLTTGLPDIGFQGVISRCS
ncbi:MAG TPA: class I SAM-dependent methyltransferase, partial [Chloroflexia bacterium]|nr:class I SAM-dependent methyltransferase [Chloroflexia bacterium]